MSTEEVAEEMEAANSAVEKSALAGAQENMAGENPADADQAQREAVVKKTSSKEAPCPARNGKHQTGTVKFFNSLQHCILLFNQAISLSIYLGNIV